MIFNDVTFLPRVSFYSSFLKIVVQVLGCQLATNLSLVVLGKIEHVLCIIFCSDHPHNIHLLGVLTSPKVGIGNTFHP